MNDAKSRQDLEEVLSAAMSFAKRMIESHGEFHPFGAKLAPDGTVALMGIDSGEEFPKGAPLVHELQRALQDQATDGQVQAAAVCFLAEVLLKDWVAKKTVAVFRLAHSSGKSAEVMLPFEISEGLPPTYGALAAVPAKAFSLLSR